MTYRIFSIIAYDYSDNLSYNEIYSRLINTKFTYFIIKHDKDTTKLHYHITIYVSKPTTIDNVSKKLAIPTNYIKVKDDFGNRYTLKSTIKYLIHYNDDTKFNYNINDIITNNYDIVKKYYDIISGGNCESQELKEILLFIENNNCNCKALITYCVENDLLKTFKKYSYFLNQIIKENIYERSL